MKLSMIYLFAAAIVATSVNAIEDEDKPKLGPIDKDGDVKKPKGSSGNETDVSSLESSDASSSSGTYVAIGAAGIVAFANGLL